MLQIITGKFYNSDDRFHNECETKLYSNIKMDDKIEMGHIRIEPIQDQESISTYNIFYDNQLEKSHSGFELIKVGDEEILRQLKNILSFAMNGVFDEDKLTVKELCREKNPESRYSVPKDFFKTTLNLDRRLLNEDMKFKVPGTLRNQSTK